MAPAGVRGGRIGLRKGGAFSGSQARARGGRCLSTAGAVVAIVFVLALTGCTEATHPPATPAVAVGVETPDPRPSAGPSATATEPIPTMSPRVAGLVEDCRGNRIGAAIERGRVVSARYDDARWHVELEGLWHFEKAPAAESSPAVATDAPTAAPWTEIHFVRRCRMTIDTRWESISFLSAVIVTATPPAQATP